MKFSLITRAGLVLMLLLFAASAQAGAASDDLDQLLPHAVVLWKSAILSPIGVLYGGNRFVGAGDINGDGILDLVFAQPSASFLVYISKGRGEFEWHLQCYEEKIIREFPGGKETTCTGHFIASSGVLADFDRDGDLDQAMSGTFISAETGAAIPRLYIFRNQEASLFEKATSYDLEVPFDRLWEASFPGRHDLVGAVVEEERGKWSTKLYSIPWEEELRFLEPVLLVEVEGRPFSFVDVNGDNFPDLGVFTSEGVRVLLGDTGGGFSGELSFSPLEGRVKWAALGDLDGDGLLDLAVATPAGIVTALQARDGFSEAGVYTVGIEPLRVWLSDFTGDGHPDALVWDKGAVLTILPGDGQGDFLGSGSEYALPRQGIPYPVDIDQDGRTDLVVEGRFSSFVLMTGGEPRGESLLPFGGRYLLGVGDLNGNGALDLLAQDQTRLEVLWNVDRGAMLRRTLLDLAPAYPLAAVVAQHIAYVLSVRIDEAQQEILWELFAIDARGTILDSFPLGNNVIPVLAKGDLDGDGKSEIVAVKKGAIWALWGGEESREYPWPRGLSLIEVADLDGDGMDELVFTSPGEQAQLISLGFSNRSPLFPRILLEFEALPLGLAVGDMDGDGVDDAAVIGATFRGESKGEGLDINVTVEVERIVLGVALSQGGATVFDLPWFPKADIPWPLTGLAAGDFTGDGLIDLACSSAGGNGVFVLPGNGDGTFGEPVTFQTQIGPLLSADLDGTGQVDLAGSILGARAAIWILWNGGGR